MASLNFNFITGLQTLELCPSGIRAYHRSPRHQLQPLGFRLNRQPVGIHIFLHFFNNPAKVKLPSYITSPVILNSLRIWRQIHSFMNLSKVYVDSSICKNHAFPPGLNDSIFSAWKVKNIVTIGDLY